jgi:hypothetical protein
MKAAGLSSRLCMAPSMIRPAQEKWQNVAFDFIGWLKEKGNGGREGADGEDRCSN